MIRTWLIVSCSLSLVAPAAAQIVLPDPTGPHKVGTITVPWVDESRSEIVTDDPGDKREVIVQLWYPAQVSDRASAPYFPKLHVVLETMRSKFGRRGEQMAESMAPLGSVKTHAMEEAPLASTQPKYPILLFSPGGDMSRRFHTIQAEELASHGYIVAVISHAYSTFDVFSGDRLLMSHPRWNPPREASREERDRHFEELTDYLAADAMFVLNRLEQLNRNDPGSRFTGRLDLEKTAIIGHSRGGKTVSRILTKDKRVRAGVIYDNLPPMVERGKGFDRPLLMIRIAEWEADDMKGLEQLFTNSSGAGYDVAVEGAGHRNFSDVHITDPKRFQSKIDPLRALRIANAYTLAFLRTHLHDAPDDLLKGPSDLFPEVRFTLYKR